MCSQLKKLASFLRKLGEAINQGRLHCATKQRTEFKQEAMKSHKNCTITDEKKMPAAFRILRNFTIRSPFYVLLTVNFKIYVQ
jgi:hypothetical protein